LVVFELLNLIFVLLLGDWSPNEGILSAIEVIQTVRDDDFFGWVNTVVIELQVDSAGGAVLDALVL
jgi:hypothetical protein